MRFSWKLTAFAVLLALCMAGAAVLYVTKDWIVALGVRVGIDAYNARLNSTLTVQDASFNLLTRTATLRGVSIAEPGSAPLDPPLSAKYATAQVEWWPLLKRQIVLTDVRVSEADVRYEIDATGGSNLEALFRPRTEHKPEKPSPWNVIVRHWEVQQGGGNVVMTDQSVRATFDQLALAGSFALQPRQLHVELTGGQGEVSYRVGGERLRHRFLQTVAELRLSKDRVTLDRVRLTTSDLVLTAQGVAERGGVTAHFGATVPLAVASPFFPQLPPTRGIVSLQGSVEGALKSPQVHLTVQGEQLGIGAFESADVRASVSLTPQYLEIDSFAAGLLGGKVLARGRVELTQPQPEQPRLELQVEVSDLPLTEVLSSAGVAIPPLGGSLAARVVLRSPSFDPNRVRAEGHLTLSSPTMEPPDAGRRFPIPLSLATSVRYEDRTVTLDELAWMLNGATGALAGTIRLDGAMHLSGTARADLSAPAFGQLGVPPMRGDARLAFTVQGNVRQPRVQADLELQHAGYQDIQLDHLRLNLTAEHDAVKILSLTGTQGSAHYSLVADVSLAESFTRLNLTGTPFPIRAISGLQLEVERLALSQLTPLLPRSLPLAGELSLSAKAEGSWPSIHGEGRVKFRGLSVRGERFEEVALELDASATQVRLKQLVATLGGGQVQAKGVLTFPHRVDFTMEWHGVRLEQLASLQAMNIPVTGALDGTVKAGGTWPELQAEVAMVGPRLTAYNLPVTGLQVRAVASPHALRLERFSARIAGAPLTASGNIAREGPIDLRLTSEDIPLRGFALVPERFPLGGRLRVALNGSGTLGRPVVRGQVHLTGAQAGGITLGTGDLTIGLEERRLTFSTTGLEGIQLSGGVTLDEMLPAQLRLAVRSLDLGRATASPAFGAFRGFIEGEVAAAVEVQGQLRSLPSLVGNLTVDRLRVRSNGVELRNAGPMRWRLARGVLEFEAIRLRGQGANLELRGAVNLLEEGLDVTLSGTGPLAIIGTRIPELRFPQGTVDMRVRVRGPWRQPGFEGQVLLRDGVITIPALNESVTQLKGDIQFGEHTIGIQSLEGKLAGGDVKASGQLELQELRVRRISLTTQASQIRLRYPANFSALLNAELVVTGDQDGQQITGEVGLTRARYREEIDLTALLLRYRRRQIEPPRVARETPQFDIRVYTTDPLRVENRMARIDLAVDVAVRGSPNQPVILGRVEVERGTANVVGNRFTNIGGSVDFLNQTQIEPFFDIATDTQKSGYKIHVTATGTPQQFDLHLTSDPPLNEEDVLRLLALGATGEALATAAGAALPGRLSSFLTGQFAEEIGRGVGSLVGLDRIEIDPVSGGKHGLAGPKVLVGKDLSRALSITYTTTFGPTRENIVSLEYRITDNISLLGIRDERGEVGVDLKFSFRFE